MTRAVEALSGNSIYQVTFGEMAELSDEMRQHFPQAVGSLPPKRIGSNVLVLFFSGDAAAPYKVGSRWRIEVGGSGEISVRGEEQ